MKESKLKKPNELSEELSIDAHGNLKVISPKSSIQFNKFRLHPIDAIITSLIFIFIALNIGVFIILRHTVFYYLQPTDTQEYWQAWELIGTILGLMDFAFGMFMYVWAQAYFSQLIPKRIIID